MLSAITNRFAVARRDSLDAMQALVSGRNLDAGECLSGIIDTMWLTDEIVSSTSILTLLSSAMENQTDEYLVDRALAGQIQHSLASIAETRRVINQQAGRCGASAVVVTKAQMLLSILDDSERILSSLSRRF
jgi:hypothetical protein